MVLFKDHEAQPSDIIKWADLAMYQGKSAGRNSIRFYDEKI
jgi:GGDEF domain-containing protein